MTKPTSKSSDLSTNQESGATDSLWQPSWLQWLISALSSTVETEKQIAWLKKSNEELRKNNEELRKNNEELRKENERLAELELKFDAVLHKSATNSIPLKSTDKN